MKNHEISALAEDVAEIVSNETAKPKQVNTGLIKFFIIAFILLLIYLLADKFLINKTTTTNGKLNVIGFFYGPVDNKSNDEVLVSLGPESKLNSGITKTNTVPRTDLPDQKPEVKPKPDLLKLLSTIQLGTEYKEVTKIMGPPNKKLDVLANKHESGFKIYVWENSPRILLTFYKDGLISKISK
jgi:hypothetical protein